MIVHTLALTSVQRKTGDREVLAGIDLEITAGEIVALVGTNGAGKSTLIRTILDLRAAHGGTVEIGGLASTDRHARTNVAYLPERFQPPAWLRGHEFLTTMQALYNVARDRAAATAVAGELGLTEDTLAAAIATYSKGTAQLLGLAACLASQRSLLIFDEPMDGLDPAARVRLRNALHARRDAGTSVLFSTHLLADAAELADRVAILHGGRIVADGSPTALCERFDAPTLEAAYLGCTNDLAQPA